MKILWLCGTMLPDIAADIGVRCLTSASWLVNAAKQLCSYKESELCICFPMNNSKRMILGCLGGMRYYGFPQSKPVPTQYNIEIEKFFKQIIKEYKPDVVHIWGTEYPHTLSMLRVCQQFDLLEKTVVSIQGLCHVIAKHYHSMLPYNVLSRYTLFDLLKRENVKKQIKNFEKRGEYEFEALKLSKNVIGRTEWDKACVTQVNPDVKYHFCNETLRESFYENKWDIDKCQKHSVFISQGYYPIKGLHFVLEAIGILIMIYPDIKLYVGGLDIINRGWKTSSYGKYIKELIKKYQLENAVVFTGMLDEKNMVKQYLNANVFVSASAIENSPNSVGEAMCLGMPVVSSDVGGVKDLMTHGVEGYIYPYDEPYMLAFYIKELFENIEIAKELASNARIKGLKTHDSIKNLNQLIKIYSKL